MRIVFLYSSGRTDNVKEVNQGLGASELYFGALELRNREHDVKILDIDKFLIDNKIINLFQRVINQNILPSRSDLKLVLTMIPILGKISKYDIVVGTTSGIALVLGLLQLLGLLRKPVIGIHYSLLNYPQRRLQLKLMKKIFARTWSQIFGEGELSGMLECFEIPRVCIEVSQTLNHSIH